MFRASRISKWINLVIVHIIHQLILVLPDINFVLAYSSTDLLLLKTKEFLDGKVLNAAVFHVRYYQIHHHVSFI